MLCGRRVPKRVVARRTDIDIGYALYLRKQLGHNALFLGDIVRIAQRHLNAIIEICRNGLDGRRGNILNLAQELAREPADVIEAGFDRLGAHRLARRAPAP